MNYNSALQVNNDELQSLIIKASEFPEAEVVVNDVSKSIINRTITNISDNTVTKVRPHAFYYCTSLTSVNLPICSIIDDNAFYSCTKLTHVNFPICKIISASAFAYCFNLSSISFLPACSIIGDRAFDCCYSITEISFPACTNIGYSAFDRCTNLTTADFSICQTIEGRAFARCYVISSITIRTPKICALSNSNAFSSTPYAGYSAYFSGTPYIYVPASLVSAYQSATNWVYYSSYFSSIDSLLITFTIDTGLGIVEFYAEEGMTWEEWVNSEYNSTNSFYIVNGRVYYADIEFIGSNDLIISNKCYDAAGGGWV